MKILITGEQPLLNDIIPLLKKEGHNIIFMGSEKDCKDIYEKFGITTVVGDASKREDLSSIENLDMLISLNDNEKENLAIGMLAREIGVKKVIIRLKTKDYENVAKENGIYPVIESKKILEEILNSLYEIGNYIEVDEIKIFKVSVMEKSEIVGKKLKEIKGNGDKFFIFGIKRNGDFYFYDKDLIIRAGDTLYISTNRNISEVINSLQK